VTVEYYFKAALVAAGIYFDEPGSVAPDYYVRVRPFSLRTTYRVVKETYRLVDTITQGGRTTIEIYAARRTGPDALAGRCQEARAS
jgi:hypothetical protein